MATVNSLTQEIAEDWERHAYYENVESPRNVAIFWGENSRFRRQFEALDLTRVIDLACGHGRHTQQVVDRCGQAVLMDVNESNVRFCRDRFAAYHNVRCARNDGSVYSGIADASVTAIFCYDAMVHFEAEDVLSYIRDTARVLVPGGRALFHYSNFDGKPGDRYSSNPHHRNFMTERLFRHMASRAGLTVLHSEVFGWGGGENLHTDLDALTLVEKPA